MLVYLDNMIYALMDGHAEQKNGISEFQQWLVQGTRAGVLIAPWSVAHLSEILPLKDPSNRIALLEDYSLGKEVTHFGTRNRSVRPAFAALLANRSSSNPDPGQEALLELAFFPFREYIVQLGFQQSAYDEAEKKGISPFDLIDQRFRDFSESKTDITVDFSFEKIMQEKRTLALTFLTKNLGLMENEANALLDSMRWEPEKFNDQTITVHLLRSIFRSFLEHYIFPESDLNHPVIIDTMILDTFNYCSETKKEQSKRKKSPFWQELWDQNHLRNALHCNVFITEDQRLQRKFKAALKENGVQLPVYTTKQVVQ